jgi:small subunit ribosomal protein S21
VNKTKNYYPEERNGICVVRRENESDESLLKRFRKRFSKSGMIKEVRERMYFEKPSDKRRRKKAQQIRAIEKEIEKQQKLKAKSRKNRLKRQRKERKHDSSGRRQNRSSSYEKGSDRRRDRDSNKRS